MNNTYHSNNDPITDLNVTKIQELEHQITPHLNLINRNSFINRKRSNEQTYIHYLDTKALTLLNSRKSSKLYPSFNENIDNYGITLDEAQFLADETLKKLDQIKFRVKSNRIYCCCCGYCCCHGNNSHKKCINNKINPEENLIYITNRDEILENPNLIFNYVKTNETERLGEILAYNPFIINQCDSNQRTLLHYAAMKGYLDCASVLVAHKARINEPDHNGNLPIHLAVKEGHLLVVRYLLSVNADPTKPNKNGLLPIHIACEKNYYGILKALLELDNVSVNAEGERGASPLHYCCIHDSVECMEILLNKGANIFAYDLEHTYPVHVAIANVSRKCLNLLFKMEAYLKVHHLNQPIKSQRTKSSFNIDTQHTHVLCNTTTTTTTTTNSSSIVKYDIKKKSIDFNQFNCYLNQQNNDKENNLINLTDCEGETPLHAAVTSGNSDMVKFCLEHNAFILAKQNDDSTPVHYACMKGDLECVQLMFESDPSIKSIVFIMPDKNGYTPLHLAAVYNHEKLVTYLVEQGSPLEMTETNGWTPLLLAAMKGALQTCIQLLRLGANPNAHDSSNRNLVHLLMLFQGPGIRTVLPELNDEELFKRLVNEKDKYGTTPLHYSTKMGNLGATIAFVLRGASALERDNERNTSLHTAAYYGRLHTCEKLLATPHGIRAMNCPDAIGRLPLHVAVEHGHIEIVKMFLDRGCLFRKCHLGNTPLHYVSIGGCIKICKLLLQSSPSLLNQTNFHGMTALHYAAKENNAEVLDYLLTSKAKILPDNDGIYFVTYALQRRNYETMKAIVTHSRWPELHEMLDNTSQCPVDGFIRNMPSMCKLVLDRCIKEIGTKNTPDHKIFYDFSILQRPMNPTEKPPQDPMKRIKLMVELKREELLIHPLCKAYLERKWQTYGRWVQLCVSVYYAVLLLAITCLVLGHNPIHHIENVHNISNCTELFYETPTRMYVFSTIASIILVLTAFDLCIKIWQLLTQKYEYFKDWNNYLEFILNTLAMSYSALTLNNQLNYNYIELGVIVMFLAWFNFLLQMMRFKHVGIFVVMFLHVFATVGKCLVVFSVVFIAFALSFHVLFRAPGYSENITLLLSSSSNKSIINQCFPIINNNQLINKTKSLEIKPFQYIGLSLFKTLMMMLGEYEHTTTIIEPFIENHLLTLNYPIITFFFYTTFVFLVPIILMNLLIGLAVGDIENVRRTAFQHLISQQVYWLADLEPKLTRIFRSKLYQSNWKKKTKLNKTTGFLDKSGSEMTYEENLIQKYLKETIKKLTSIDKETKLQTTRMAEIIEKLEIRSKEFSIDEGVYPREFSGFDPIMEMDYTTNLNP
ncbi:unnamed protein product [Schistosoma rodhaini]|uniref:Ion transport domain-containing protein n=1 Tax=Schistosoma rodhaini TaxID=6188 RepID=A0AA85GAD1_9TREM|nr:unnamed protein product [Schistosoma rodhaini]